MMRIALQCILSICLLLTSGQGLVQAADSHEKVSHQLERQALPHHSAAVKHTSGSFAPVSTGGSIALRILIPVCDNENEEDDEQETKRYLAASSFVNLFFATVFPELVPGGGSLSGQPHFQAAPTSRYILLQVFRI